MREKPPEKKVAIEDIEHKLYLLRNNVDNLLLSIVEIRELLSRLELINRG